MILFSTFSLGIFAQIDPPSIGCTEILPNGDVKLSWIPPSDPNNQFASYEIYYSTQKNGPFTLVPAVLSAINTTSVIFTVAGSSVQSCYFYMLTRYGPAGASSSAHSDTIPTIYLTAGPGSKTWNLQITFLPGAKFPAPHSFNVLKEYPLGTWKNLAATTSTVYPDTISGGCKVGLKINYQITLQKSNATCLFASNTLSTSLSDTKDPEQPYVDSISVLSNGNTILAWQIPIDKDINRYRIQYRTINGQVVTNQDIDSLNGRNTTSYIYTTTTANSQTVGLFVKALDSCGRGSSVYDQIRTMFLKVSYDQCAYRSVLKWNHYKWAEVNGKAKETTLEYRIYYSVNGSNFIRIGKTTDTTFVHDSVAPGKNICYFVRVVNVGQTITASSNRSCFFSDQTASPKFVYIKTASVMDKSSVQVKVYLDTSEVCKGISIQRLDHTTNFVTVGFIPFNGDPHAVFIDEGVNPSQKNYTYKAVVIDSCGNPRAVSAIAKTILLKVQEDDALLFTKHLSWSDYVGFGGGVSGYSIYRVVNDNTSAGPIGYTDSQTTFFTDDLEAVASEGAKIEYVVHAVEGLSNPYGISEQSYSNPASVYEEGRLFVPNAFAPSGVNKTWKPVTHFIEKTEYKVTVFNRWGKKVFETSDDVTEWDGENCTSDVYVYLIDYKNARGEYQQVKGTVMLIR